MAKDPRFNFYPDNWDGGTEDFTLEQEGAYLRLIIMQSRKGRFTKEQAIDTLMSSTRGDAAACAGLWFFLMPKLATDGKVFWSERQEKEIAKSKRFSEKQSERAKSRFSKKDSPSGIHSGTAAAVPEIEMEVEIELEEKLKESLDEIYLSGQRASGKWNHIDFDFELSAFMEKVRGSPDHYRDHDSGGIRLALQSQLRKAKPKNNGPANHNNKKQQYVDGLAAGIAQRYGLATPGKQG